MKAGARRNVRSLCYLIDDTKYPKVEYRLSAKAVLPGVFAAAFLRRASVQRLIKSLQNLGKGTKAGIRFLNCTFLTGAFPDIFDMARFFQAAVKVLSVFKYSACNHSGFL